MQIDVLTLFPGMFASGPMAESILGRARESGLLDVRAHDLRPFGLGAYKQVDDRPYGGGAGMLLRPDVMVSAIETVQSQGAKPHRIFLTPRGRRLTQHRVEQLARKERLLLVCGHYEGMDQRVVDGGWIDEELSIGDYVLTGGELPAMVLIDAVARQLPGVLGHEESAAEESFSTSIGRKKEYPHYTRPEVFRDMAVPPVLLSGNHAEIERWRKKSVR